MSTELALPNLQWRCRSGRAGFCLYLEPLQKCHSEAREGISCSSGTLSDDADGICGFHSMTNTLHETVIDHLVLLVRSTAHFWHITGIAWAGRISIAVISAILNVYGMLIVARWPGD